jgi:periplasmic mercuric ion binding protein
MDTNQALWASAPAASGASLGSVVLLLLVRLGMEDAWLAALARLDPARPVFWLTAIPLLALCTAPVLAAQMTVELAVPGMNCAACPITVRKALAREDGVIRAEVDYGTRQVSAAFDDARTSIDPLTCATAEAGYPSSIKGRGQ